MKKISILLIIAILIVSNVVSAQKNDTSWTFKTGFNIVDIRIPKDFGGIVKDYFNGSVEDLNFYGVPLRFAAEKHLNKGLSVQLATSMNKIKRGSHLNNGIGLTNSNFFILDAKLKYEFANLFHIDKGWFDPFAGVGFGYSAIGDYDTVFPDLSGKDLKIGAGGGFNAWLSDKYAIAFESYYHHNFKNTFSNEGNSGTGTDFFQHSIMLIYRPIKSNSDSDGDGIKDKKDKCPNAFGYAKYDGCDPLDSDNDGIIDTEDDCPNQVGIAKNKGCPDNKDSDNDGIIDSEDKCQDEAGPISNNGCPWKDSDGDGVLDQYDNCPNTFGDADNNGCPKNTAKVITPKKETKKETSEYDETIFPDINIYFEIDSYEISIEQTLGLINAIYFIKESNALFLIEGHTDTGGTSRYNRVLSKRRVNAVKNFLTSKGVAKEKLVLMGVGEMSADPNNVTENGKANNRRVTISMINN